MAEESGGHQERQEHQEQRQEPKPAPCYGVVPAEPVMEAAEGILFDFNDGLRVKFPAEGGPWRVVFRDLDTHITVYDQEVAANAYIGSVKKYFVRFQLQIFHKGEKEPFFEHSYDAAGKTVMIQMAVPTVGDTLGWFPYVEKFRRKHACRVVAVLQPQFIELFRGQYPAVDFITLDEIPQYRPYACYYVGLFFKGDTDRQPYDFRLVGLHKTAGYILGVDTEEERPRFDLSAPRTIKEPYVCIAVQSSSQAKYWNNPFGWHEVIQFLKESGYRVLCIDRERAHGQGLVVNHIPNGCEDFTGNIPLQERINLIKDADFFVGLASGLSWLAWGCGVPVVMISGFSHPSTEFYTPYRVINPHACNSCWNDMRVDFDHFDFLWCPRHKGTPRHFECTRLIAAEQVIDTIKRIPIFRERTHAD